MVNLGSLREENKGKLQKRARADWRASPDRSLRKFQAYLGLSYSYSQSGDKKTRQFHGSTLVRSHLYVWAGKYGRTEQTWY